MWDVIWTDPDRELVGEHRAKKERKQKDSGSDKPPTAARALSSASSRLRRHNSVSVTSARSSLSSTEHPLAFLKPKGLRHMSTNNVGAARTKSPVSSGLASPSNLSTRSPMSPAFDNRSQRSSGIIPLEIFDPHSDVVRRGQSMDKSIDSGGELSPSCTSRHDSVFSKYPESDGVTSASITGELSTESAKPASLVQTLGPSSFVTKQTEVSSSPKDEDFHGQGLTTEVVISASHTLETLPISPQTSPRAHASPIAPLFDSVPPLVPPLKSPLRILSPKWPNSLQHHNPEAWRPPDEWACTPSDTQAPTIDNLTEELVSAANIIKDEKSALAPDLKTLRREVERMAAATPEVILSRLKEVWVTTPDTELHEELEMEKKRWMLSALHHLDLVPELDTSRPSGGKIVMANAQKILALYESHYTTSYLAALYHTKQLYHMSPSPLSHDPFPNICPLLTPSISPSLFPGAPSMFDAVYALSLPSLAASKDLPAILANIHRCLRPGAALHLTLVDPLPAAPTLGAHLRAWLEQHLLLNLARHFRCAHPTQLFPQWLGQAGLRGAGSTLTSAKFFAVPDNARSGLPPDPDSRLDSDRRGRETKAELRSLVGRMLWTEVWGRYVTAERWWWEEEKCVQECVQLGTFWEYQKIEGVKESE